ncbi:MAG: hypothetical protein ACO1NS_14335 [Daejeonella sp.]
MMKCKRYLLPVLFLAMFSSCRKEDLPSKSIELVNLEFKLGTPNSRQQSIQTYSLTPADENAIKSIILLAFKVVSPGVETFQYHKEGMQIYPGSTVNEKKFFTSIQKSPETYRFVLLVNGGDQVSDQVENLVPNTAKEDVIQNLSYMITTKWDASSSATFTPLPMWGESSEIAGIHAQTVLPQVELLRSLSRIDIKLDPALSPTHTITDIYVQNANDKASMAPFPSSYDGLGNLISPSIPPGTNPLDVQHYDFTGDNLTSIEGEIYLLEAEAASSPGASDATALAIGISENEGATEYYRIDFLSSGVPIPLLRNRKYSITISNIVGTGELNPLDVFSLAPPDRTVAEGYKISGIRITRENGLSIRINTEQ